MLVSRGEENAELDPGLTAAAIDGLSHARAQFETLSLKPSGFATLKRGLERSYRHGRQAFSRAYGKPADEAYHELRKQVQLHWRQMQLLERAWPEYCAARVAAARELSQILGEDQDLSVLKAFLKRAQRDQMGPLEAKSIRRAIRDRQNELRDLAWPRAHRLFAERPEDLGRHVNALWSSAKRIRDHAPAEAPAADDKQAAAPRLKLQKPPKGQQSIAAE